MYICIDSSQRFVVLHNSSSLLLNYNENFCTARKKITEQAHKALFAVYKKIRNISIPVDLQLKLFESLVSPILVYASEVWSFENKESIELTRNDNFSLSCIHCKFP
jgi:folylpolyglutamate synthase/dihydropteroate synthase